MIKKILIGLVILLIILAIGFWAWKSSQRNTPVATINGETFSLYVAESVKDKQIGLSKYDELEDKRGMIFAFDKPDYYSFWMKSMKFPIDIIFINKDKIVTIHKNVSPPEENQELNVYISDEPADKVIEIKAGASDKYSFKEGDTVTLSNI